MSWKRRNQKLRGPRLRKDKYPMVHIGYRVDGTLFHYVDPKWNVDVDLKDDGNNNITVSYVCQARKGLRPLTATIAPSILRVETHPAIWPPRRPLAERQELADRLTAAGYKAAVDAIDLTL